MAVLLENVITFNRACEELQVSGEQLILFVEKGPLTPYSRELTRKDGDKTIHICEPRCRRQSNREYYKFDYADSDVFDCREIAYIRDTCQFADDDIEEGSTCSRPDPTYTPPWAVAPPPPQPAWVAPVPPTPAAVPVLSRKEALQLAVLWEIDAPAKDREAIAVGLARLRGKSYRQIYESELEGKPVTEEAPEAYKGRVNAAVKRRLDKFKEFSSLKGHDMAPVLAQITDEG